MRLLPERPEISIREHEGFLGEIVGEAWLPAVSRRSVVRTAD